MRRRALLTGAAALAAYSALRPARAGMGIFAPAIIGGDSVFPPPIGLVPGFNPSHLASKGVQFSAVAFNGSMMSLNNYFVPTNIGAPSAGIDPYLGYVMDTTAAVTQPRFTVRPATTLDPNTTAFICMRTAGASNRTLGGWITSTPTSSWEFFWNSVTGNFSVFNGAGTQDSTITFSNNVPYFMIASSLTGGNMQWTVMDLRSGKITQATSAGGAPVADSGIIRLGVSQNLKIAAMMASNVAIKAAMQLAWAQDPWSFWYPGRNDPVDNIVAASAPVGGALRQLPLSGVGP